MTSTLNSELTDRRAMFQAFSECLVHGGTPQEIADKLLAAAQSPAAPNEPAQPCTYPKCNCPFDAPSDPNWCAQGLAKPAQALPALPDYMKWWTSLETDLRKLYIQDARKDTEFLHALLKEAFEAGAERAAIASPRPRVKLDPELKAALDEAAKTRSTTAMLPSGEPIFINYGDQPEDTAHLECTACGGSGHIEDQQAIASRAQPGAQPAKDDDADNLSVMLWLLRRLPRSYENPPHIVQAIRRIAARTGTDLTDSFSERAASNKGEGK